MANNLTAAELRERAAVERAASEAAAQRTTELLKQAQKLEREERQAKERAEVQAADDKAWEEIGQHFYSREVHAIVYGQAYADGHAYGYSEVHGRYQDLAELAVKLLKVAK